MPWVIVRSLIKLAIELLFLFLSRPQGYLCGPYWGVNGSLKRLLILINTSFPFTRGFNDSF